MSGSIHQVSVSQGGVPKLPVETVDVVVGGIVQDDQTDRRNHGGPDQDLCLYSLEVIEALQAEGHPIEPGFAGENLTIAALDWSEMRSGLRLTIGETVTAELTSPAAPCSKNADWFAGRDFRRMSFELHPGWSRWYARVIVGGTVRQGDPVEVVEPAAG